MTHQSKFMYDTHLKEGKSLRERHNFELGDIGNSGELLCRCGLPKDIKSLHFQAEPIQTEETIKQIEKLEKIRFSDEWSHLYTYDIKEVGDELIDAINELKEAKA